VEKHVDQLSEALERLERDLLVVVTGAGISLASGIPTFRGTDPGAIWKHDVLELGTFDYFRRDPVGSWRWYLKRFDHVLGKKPNDAHYAIAALERWQLDRGGRFLLVTQNIDTLHEEAGSEEMVKVHGTADRVRCARVGCRHGAPSGSLPRSEAKIEAFLADPSTDTLPRCPECGDVLRQHLLWFDEYYNEHRDYQWDRVQDAALRMSFGLFVGTSFSVGVTDLFLRAGLGVGTPLWSIDPGDSPLPVPGLTLLPEKAEELLPEVCKRLGAV
jgi:NAD-dependent deacetylase